jgi:hypothetical protein
MSKRNHFIKDQITHPLEDLKTLTPEARTKTSKRSAFNFNDEKTISTQDENDN